MNTNELLEQVKEYKKLKEIEAQAKKEAEMLKAKIYAILDESPKEEAVVVGDYKVNRQTFEKRYVDTKALKASGLYEEYSEPRVEIRLVITKI